MDLSRPVGESDLQVLRDALLRYSVVTLRDQNLTPEAQIELVSRIYPLSHKTETRFTLPNSPQLTRISNIKVDGNAIGLEDAGVLWHTDGIFTSRPELFVCLHAIEIPSLNGAALGDTLFSSCIEAYDAFADPRKADLCHLTATHSYGYHIDKLRRLNTLRRPVDDTKLAMQAEHPVVRTHPITGRKLLYVTDSFTSSIVGMSAAEGSKLIYDLSTHITQEQFVYRHKWQVGDVVIWDNCATQHLATQDYETQRRLLHRVASSGPVTAS